MRTCELGRLTWKEAEEALARKPVVLIPIGAVEPHGPQLPLGTDYIVAHYVAVKAAEKCKDALVAPTIPYGYCDTVEDFPGAMSLDMNTLGAVIRDLVSNLAKHGVDKIVFVNNHRANSVALAYVARKLRKELGIEMATFFPWGVIQSFCPSMYQDFIKVFGHGAEPETSVMHAVWPEDVRMDLAEAGQYAPKWGIPTKGPSTLDFHGTPIEVYFDSSELTDSGTMGDPFAYSDERGRAMIEQAINRLAEFVEFFKGVTIDIKRA